MVINEETQNPRIIGTRQNEKEDKIMIGTGVQRIKETFNEKRIKIAQQDAGNEGMRTHMIVSQNSVTVVMEDIKETEERLEIMTDLEEIKENHRVQIIQTERKAIEEDRNNKDHNNQL